MRNYCPFLPLLALLPSLPSSFSAPSSQASHLLLPSSSSSYAAPLSCSSLYPPPHPSIDPYLLCSCPNFPLPLLVARPSVPLDTCMCSHCVPKPCAHRWHASLGHLPLGRMWTKGSSRSWPKELRRPCPRRASLLSPSRLTPPWSWWLPQFEMVLLPMCSMCIMGS